MAILNYTTKINVETTIAEIESTLAKSGAKKIFKDYDGNGNVEAIAFIIETGNGLLNFRLPMNMEAVLQTLKNQSGEYRRQPSGKQVRIVPDGMVNKEQAARVGWRIIKDWLEAQLALYFLQMVKIEEIFLPYMYDNKTGKTMFQMLEQKGFTQLEHQEEQ